MMSIIAFVSGKQSGKTLAANYLCQNYGYVKLSLGDPLKHSLKLIFNFTDEQLWGDKKEIIDEYWGITPRHAMQVIGTDLFRLHMGQEFPHIGDNIWVKSLERRILEQLQQGHSVVIDDIRFPNEAELIRKMGGLLIRITRPNVNQNVNNQHSSEQSNQQIITNYTINNNGSIEHFYDKIESYLNK